MLPHLVCTVRPCNEKMPPFPPELVGTRKGGATERRSKQRRYE